MITIAAKDFSLTDGIKAAINDKLNKLEKFADEQKVEVVLESNRNRKKVKVFLRLDNSDFEATERDDDLYKALNSVVYKLEKQVRRHLDKKIKKGQESLRHFTYANNTKTNESDKPKIVKRKLFSHKPMFEEEAINQMELLNHRSFVFFNADTNSICMLYKRHDGNYGIIESE